MHSCTLDRHWQWQYSIRIRYRQLSWRTTPPFPAAYTASPYSSFTQIYSTFFDLPTQSPITHPIRTPTIKSTHASVDNTTSNTLKWIQHDQFNLQVYICPHSMSHSTMAWQQGGMIGFQNVDSRGENNPGVQRFAARRMSIVLTARQLAAVHLIGLHCVSKNVPTFKLSVTLSNLNRFSQFLHCWKAYEICYKTHMTSSTSP